LMANALHLFGENSLTYRDSWGKSFSPWRDPRTPEASYSFYQQSAGQVELAVKTSEGLVVKSWQMDGINGLNFIQYDLSIDADKMNAYESERKKEDEDFVLKKADNGIAYLHPGDYRLLITQGDQSISAKLTVKKPRTPPKR
ncbi:MAG: hypothetical protein AAF206_14155, partial [Bacteroidota bacterium]